MLASFLSMERNNSVPRLLSPNHFRLMPPACFQDTLVAAGQDMLGMQQDSKSEDATTTASQDNMRVQDGTVTTTIAATAAGQDSLRLQDMGVTTSSVASPDNTRVQDRTNEASPGVPPSDHQQRRKPVRTRETPTARAAIQRLLNGAKGEAKHSLPPAGAQPVPKPIAKPAANPHRSLTAKPAATPPVNPHRSLTAKPAATPPVSPHRSLWLDQQKNRAGQWQNRFSKTLPTDKSLSEKDRVKVVSRTLKGVVPTACPNQHCSECEEEEEEEGLNDLNIDCSTVHSNWLTPVPGHHQQAAQHSGDLRSEVSGHQQSTDLRNKVSGHQQSSDLRQEGDAANMASGDGSTVSDAELASILQEEEYSQPAYHHEETHKDGRRTQEAVGGRYPPGGAVGGEHQSRGGSLGPGARSHRIARGHYYSSGGVVKPPGAGKPPSASGEDVQSDAVLARLMQEELDQQSALQLQERGPGSPHHGKSDTLP